MLFSEEQPLNAFVPMVFTVSGIVICVRAEQPENALSPISRTVVLSIFSGISTVSTVVLQSVISIQPP